MAQMFDVVWEKDAEQALGRVPFYARGLVRRKLEERVRSRGGQSVTLADFREAEARFRAVAAGKSEREMERMMPRENSVGAEMVVIESCHSDLSNCPNVLIQTAQWREAIEEWVRSSGVSERLRERVSGDTILHHHKLRISISGCPNGCSRPQIADVGLVGFVRPSLEPANCTACGVCERACPDAAIGVADAPPVFDAAKCQGCMRCRDACPTGCITLSQPAARLLLGGRLGRHPRLARVAAEVMTPGEVADMLDRLVSRYIQEAKPEERFGDFLARTDAEVESAIPPNEHL